MSAEYTTLAPIYDQIGMSRFAEDMTPRLVNAVQSTDWMGRRVLELGCGTGLSAFWFAQHGYFVTGLDNSPEMLRIARAHLATDERHSDYKLLERDIRALSNDLGTFDLVLALDVFNELNNLRELEAVFRDVATLLNPGKLLLFDMQTIQGLTLRGSGGDQMVFDDETLTVFCRNSYDYEHQTHSCRYVIFRNEDTFWERSEANRVLRAFPAQVIATLLQRCGFGTIRALTTQFELFDPATSQAERILFIAEKR